MVSGGEPDIDQLIDVYGLDGARAVIADDGLACSNSGKRRLLAALRERAEETIPRKEVTSV